MSQCDMMVYRLGLERARNPWASIKTSAANHEATGASRLLKQRRTVSITRRAEMAARVNRLAA